MPGRTPSDAFTAFMEPLESAASVLGQAKITVSPGGRSVQNKDHSWTLNGGRGYTKHGWHFEAAMMYRIVDDPERGPWRVRTLAYRYRLAVPPGQDVFRMHWHPGGNSDIEYPHMHLALAPVDTVGDTLKKHQPVRRQTFEDAIRWAVAVGLKPARDDWEALLEQAERDHLRHRSWH